VSAATDSLLDDLLRVATIADVLDFAGIAPPVNERKNIRCPLPEHADSEPSFSIQKSGQGWKCFGCGRSGGVVDLVLALKLAPSKKDAVDLLAARYRLVKGLGGSSARALRVPKALSLEVRADAPLPSLTAEERRSLAEAVRGCRPLLGTPGEEYLRGRGVDSVFADACRVRYHPSWLGRGEAVVFPGCDGAGRLVCAQGRFLKPVSGPKAMSRGKVALGVFSTPQAFAKGLYGRSGPVAVAEAPLDALALAMKGLPSIATFGAGNRPAWLVEALAWREVVIATDADAAGEKASEDLKTWLNLGTRKTRMRFGGAKDAAEMLEQAPEKLALLVEEAIRSASPLHRAVTSALEAASNLGRSSEDEPDLLSYAETRLGSTAPVEDAPPVADSLLDEAGEVLPKHGFDWHEDWPKARPSAFPSKGYAYYTLGGEAHRYEYDETVTLPTPTPVDELRATPVPAKIKPWVKKTEPNLNVCGGCGERFTGPTAQASADALRQHIESDPCEHYRAAPKVDIPRAWHARRCGGCGEWFEAGDPQGSADWLAWHIEQNSNEHYESVLFSAVHALRDVPLYEGMSPVPRPNGGEPGRSPLRGR
jgi:hypothetical protein